MLVIAAAAVGAMLGAASIAGAVVNTQSNDTTAPTTNDDSTTTLDSTTNDDSAITDSNETDEANESLDRQGGDGETPLTGQTATDISQAALTAVPGGTIEWIETDADGAAYEAHMLDADGNPITVTFDESYKLMETITGKGGRGGDRGGHDETPLTGQVADDVTAAALAAAPGGTVDEVEAEDHGTAVYEAHVTDADGNDIRVTLDESIAVVEIMPGR